MLTFPTLSRSIALPTGRLDITVEEAAWPLDDLCDFAARENPRRGFLVVSRVLGRHLPVAPRVMRRSVRDLAARIPADLPGPVMVVGLAETAVCLGQTVHEELRLASGRDDIHFIHSTRQRLDHPLLCRFEEPHSHASAHLIYRPALPRPRSLVIVDDEISTGTTLCNLARALVEAWPEVEAIVVATLTDWSAGRGWQARMPRPARVASLLTGRLAWTQGQAPVADAAFDMAAASLGRMDAHRNFGRLGLDAPVADPPSAPLPPVAGPLRIVGTGEFTYLPFRLAERMAREGHDVVVQATSRSPARVAAAMKTRLCFADNYGTSVPNYLYNADPADRRTTWIGHETGAATIDPALIAALDARLIGWDA
ncbi:phosphoribosyltransferase domain-containing protein [Novosphingobium album (ex Liu et al. 2023)]|uniref:Phosphoribosyltransferase domain-containing protein n=1 Tax=Novosphingobium album (ex Liu et al. 2023) TaxID=3031130 RepID=A0ABT5WQN2_9SPHN|nr:phosphoribosyltransferase domain-containing protein [Novosphingobium album (ex Liu et al. 2023)]MDE8652321.1 phosphoribosyltransferase domain-containing protein [Novosphingobium album (ex Liu et al. 2023)]